ncbi:MAG: hypothetical protein IJ640_09400 [Prevotella sp.]|nr:hypothetical protein [Prevotella sp.]
MKTIELTSEQRDKVMSALDNIEDGRLDIDIELDENVTINAKGWLETDGYIEDDYHCGYMNGTGGYVETYRSASIELTALVYDEESDNVEECALTQEFENDANDYLNTIQR